jgi:hypothetical protein
MKILVMPDLLSILNREGKEFVMPLTRGQYAKLLKACWVSRIIDTPDVSFAEPEWGFTNSITREVIYEVANLVFWSNQKVPEWLIPGHAAALHAVKNPTPVVYSMAALPPTA